MCVCIYIFIYIYICIYIYYYQEELIALGLLSRKDTEDALVANANVNDHIRPPGLPPGFPDNVNVDNNINVDNVVGVDEIVV
jgi:hypothetical protein